MKGKIDKDGYLWIRRPGMLKPQTCPYSGDVCNDECPLFSEPEYYDENIATIAICNGNKLYFTELIDQRDQNV